MVQTGVHLQHILHVGDEGRIAAGGIRQYCFR